MRVIDWDYSLGDSIVTAVYFDVASLGDLPTLPEGAYRTPDEKWRANDEGVVPVPGIGWQVRLELTDEPLGGVFLFPPPEPLVNAPEKAE